MILALMETKTPRISLHGILFAAMIAGHEGESDLTYHLALASVEECVLWIKEPVEVVGCLVRIAFLEIIKDIFDY